MCIHIDVKLNVQDATNHYKDFKYKSVKSATRVLHTGNSCRTGKDNGANRLLKLRNVIGMGLSITNKCWNVGETIHQAPETACGAPIADEALRN